MKRSLEQIDIPGEHEARTRTWETVRAAFETRERVTWPRRHARSLALAAGVAAIVAAALTPPGRSVVNSVRDAVGREKVVGVRPAHRELVRLPAAGQLLVSSPDGSWVVSGSTRRRLGPYEMPSWSPHGLFVAAVKDFELYALDPKGNVRWSRGRKQVLALPRWSYEGYRVAYFSNDTLRVSVGDGSGDWGLGNANPRVAAAWRPGTHQLAYIGIDGSVRLADADARKVLWKHPAGADGVRALLWSDDGEVLLALGRSSVTVFRSDGRIVGRAPTKGSSTAAAFRPRSHTFALVVAQMVVLVNSDTLRFPSRALFTARARLGTVTWSPDGRWLLVAWPSADQFVFVRVGTPPKLVAVSNVARQFDPAAIVPRFPQVAGWCCSS